MSRRPDQPAAQALALGSTLDLYAYVYGTGVTWPDATWASSDTDVATVAPVAGTPAASPR
jgi:uncharacterized protein YjdB